MQASIISWCDQTWNPTFGCSRVSEGCRFCYAETIALKFGHSKKPWTAVNAAENVRLKPHKLREPYSLKEPSKVFVNSMSDLFHPEIPFDYIDRVFAVMADLPQHTFQILTKRPERMAEYTAQRALPLPNVWLGTSIESPKELRRLERLRQVRAAIRWLSLEPLLAALPNLDLAGIDGVVVGGESGQHMPRHPERWMPHSWAREIRDQALSAGTAFFFKQSAGLRTEMGIALQETDGVLNLWHQYPDEHPRSAPRAVRLSDSGAYRIPAAPAGSSTALPVLQL